jgi:uncharacterized protein (TIGR02444 family)
MNEASEDFWNFALRLYGRPGVAAACLELQDEHGKDVIIALYCCWLGASGRGRLDAAGLEAADATARPWRGTVVEPLRRTRHALKGVEGAEALYGRMKQIELDAERIAFQRLAPLAPDADPQAQGQADAARDNLLLYAGGAAAAAAPIIAAIAAMAART